MADANVLRTIFTYSLNGLGPYPIAFDYLARKFVQVTLLGADRKLLVLGTDYRFVSTTSIQLLKAAPAGYNQIEVRRYTSAQDRLVDFQDGSILRATDLNVSQVQTMHIAEEGRDVAGNTLGVDSGGNLDARLRKMVNLLDGVLDGDAVTIRQMKSWSESALNQADRAKAQADAAAASASAASASATAASGSQVASKASEDLAKKWAANPKGSLVDADNYSAKHYALTAVESASAASVSRTGAEAAASQASNSSGQAASSATAAKNAETNAGASADRAKTEADKLANMNDFSAVTTVDKTSPAIGTGVAEVGINTDVLTVGTSSAYGKIYLGDVRIFGGALRLYDDTGSAILTMGVNPSNKAEVIVNRGGGVTNVNWNNTTFTNIGGFTQSTGTFATNGITVVFREGSDVTHVRQIPSGQNELNKNGGAFRSNVQNTGYGAIRAAMIWYSQISGDSTRHGIVSVGSDNDSGMRSWAFRQSDGAFNSPGPVNQNSDERVKSKIEIVTDALERNRNLRGVTYQMKDNPNRQVGLIAQDVQKVLPEAVSQSTREFWDGTKFDDFLSVDVGGTCAAIHTEAIKELEAIVLKLSARIEELEAK